MPRFRARFYFFIVAHKFVPGNVFQKRPSDTLLFSAAGDRIRHNDRGAEEMMSAEPAGFEADGGNSAELGKRALLSGGAGGNTPGTVCSKLGCRCAI